MTSPQVAMWRTPEHDELAASVRAFLGAVAPHPTVLGPGARAGPQSPAGWQRMADELGLQGLAISSKYGGGDFGFVELAVVLEEMGRALADSTFFATVVLGGYTLQYCADAAAQERYLPGIVSGHLTATLAIAEPDEQWWPDTCATRAVFDGSEYRLTGTKVFVCNGAQADLVLVAATTGEGPSLFAVQPGSPGIILTPAHTLDPTRRYARIDFTDAPACPIGEPGSAGEVLRGVMNVACIAHAAEQVGGAQRCLDMAVEYAKSRCQFGRPIGSFQALKHRCADMLVLAESAQSAVVFGAGAVDAGHGDLATTAAIAKSYCSNAFLECAKANIQIHGAIGFSWEHPAHLYYRRAVVAEALFGSPAQHRDRIAELISL